MKKSIITAIAFIFSLTATAQFFKFRAYDVQVQFKNPKTSEWGEWSKIESTSLLITLDYSKQKVTLYTKKIQKFDIFRYINEKSSKEFLTNALVCIDEYGDERLVIIVSKPGSVTRLYVQSDYVTFAYGVTYIEN